MSVRPIHDYYQPGVSSTHAYHSYERWNPLASAAAAAGPTPSASDGRHAASDGRHAATSSQKQPKSSQSQEPSPGMHHRSSSSRPDPSSASYHHHHPTSSSNNNDPRLERGRRTEGRSAPSSSAPRPSAAPLASSSAYPPQTLHSSRAANKHEERGTSHKRTATEPAVYDVYGTSRRAVSASRAADASYMAPPISVRADQQATQPSSSSRVRSTDAERQREEERARRHERREEKERQRQRQRETQGMTALEQDRENERQREIEKAKERESRRARERSRANEMEMATEKSRRTEARDVTNTHSTRQKEATDERMRPVEPPALAADTDRSTHRARTREGYPDQQPSTKPMKAFRDYGDLTAQDPDSSDSARRYPAPSSRHHRRHTEEALINAIAQSHADGRGDAPPRPAPKSRHSDQMPSTHRNERQAPDPRIPSTSQPPGATNYHSSRTKPTPPEKSHRDRAIASDSTHGMSSGSDTERRHRRDNNHRMPSAQEPRRAYPGSRSVPQDPLDPSTAESYNRALAQPSHELRHTSTNRPVPSKADAAHPGSSLPPAQKPNDYATMRPPDAQASAAAMRDRVPPQPTQPLSGPQPSSRDRPEKPSRRMSTVIPPAVYPPKKDDEYAKVKASTLKIRTADVPTATATATATSHIPPSSSSRPMNITSMPERSSPEPMYSNLNQYPPNAKATSTSIMAAPPSSVRPTPLTQTRSSEGPKPSPVRPSPVEALAALLEINAPPNSSPANQSRNRSSRDKESPAITTTAAEANNVSVAAIKSARKVSFQDNDGYDPRSRAHPLDGNNSSNKPSPPVVSADPKSSSGRAYPLDNRPSPPAISAEPKSSSRAYPVDNRPSPPTVNGEPKSSGRAYPLDSRPSPPAISAEPKTSSSSRAHPLDGKPSPLTASTAPAPPMAPPISALPPQFSTSSGSATVVNDSPYKLTPIGKNDSPPRIVQIKAEDSPNSRPGNRKRKTGEEAQVRERRPEPVPAAVPEPSRRIEQPPPMSVSASREPQYTRDSPPLRPSAAAAAGLSYQSKADTNSTSPLLPHVPPPFLVPPMSAAPSTQSQSHSQQQPFVIHGLGRSILDTPSPPSRPVLLRGDTKEHRDPAGESYTPTPPVNSAAATVDRPDAQKAKLSPNYTTSFDIDPAAYGSSNNKHRDEYAKPKQSPPFSRYDGPTMSTEKLDLDLTPTLATIPGLGMRVAQAPTTPYLSSIDPQPSSSSNNYNNSSNNDGRRQQASDRRSFMAPTVPPYGAPPLEVSNRYPHNIVTVDVDARKPPSRQMPPPPNSVNDDRFLLPPNLREREREREVIEDRKASLEMPSSLANLYQAPLSHETAPMMDVVGPQASNGRYVKYADHSPLDNNNVASSRLAKEAPQAVHPSVLSQVYRSYAHGTVPPRSMPRPASRNETYATFTPTARNDSKEQLTPTKGEVTLDQLSRPRAPAQPSPGYQQQQQLSMQAVPPQMSRLTSDTVQKQQQQPPPMSSSRSPMPPQPKNSNSSTETIQTAERSRPKLTRPSGGPFENGPQPTSRRPAQTETSVPSTMPMMVSERSISNDSALLKTPSSLAPTPRLSPREHPVPDPTPVPSSQPTRGPNTSSSSKKSGGLFSMLRSKSSTPKSRAEPEYARRPGTGAAPSGKLTSQSDSSLALPMPPNKSSAAASRTMAIATQTPVAVPSQSHHQPYHQQTSQSYYQSSQPPPPSSRPAPESRPSKPKSKTLPPITIPTQVPQHSGSKVFNAFRNLGTKRHRTMSTLSIDAQASTANTTVIASPTVSSVSQAPVYPWRDPQEATSAWQKQGEKDMIKSGKERRYRPGVTFELEDDRREGSRAPMAPAATPYISSRDHYSRPVPVTSGRR